MITVKPALSGHIKIEGAQWLSDRVLDSRPRGRGFEPHRRHCVVSLSKNINPSLVLVLQPLYNRKMHISGFVHSLLKNPMISIGV